MKTNKREYNPPAIDELPTKEWIIAQEVGVSEIPPGNYEEDPNNL